MKAKSIASISHRITKDILLTFNAAQLITILLSRSQFRNVFPYLGMHGLIRGTSIWLLAGSTSLHKGASKLYPKQILNRNQQGT
jgi:hypothetical protein